MSHDPNILLGVGMTANIKHFFVGRRGLREITKKNAPRPNRLTIFDYDPYNIYLQYNSVYIYISIYIYNIYIYNIWLDDESIDLPACMHRPEDLVLV